MCVCLQIIFSFIANVAYIFHIYNRSNDVHDITLENSLMLNKRFKHPR